MSMVGAGASAVLTLMAKATAILTLAIACGWLARRQRAAVRHLIFVAAFAVLALLPLAAAFIPAVPVPVRLPAMAIAAESAAAAPLNWTGDSFPSANRRPTESRGSDRTWTVILFTLLETMWLVGMLGCLVREALGLWWARRLRRDGLPWADAQTLTNELARRARFHRPIDVRLHEAIDGPMTCGVVRAAVVFPVEARAWSHADVTRALTHEFEHVRRCDWLTFCLARTICAVYWFHPLVWMANRELCVDAERACDDAVLQEGHAVGYADQLVTLAERSVARQHPLLAMANRHDLSTRVHALLSTRQRRGPAGVRARMTAAVAAIATLAALAPLRAVAIAAGQTPAGQQNATEPAVRPQFDVASIKTSVSNSMMSVRPLPGRVIADATLQVLMQYAYGIQAFQIGGGPNWLTTARYAIDARADESANSSQLFLRLQSLLEERFQLKTHRESRELPVFVLEPGGAGVKLPAPVQGVCTESAADAAAEFAGGRMAVPGELPPAMGRCGTAIVTLGPRGAQIRGGRLAMPELTRILSLMLGRTVRDGTGFTAPFDVQVDFVPDDTTPGVPAPPPGSGISGITLAQAVQQQLGLRLQSSRGPVDVIVIDHAERPSPN